MAPADDREPPRRLSEEIDLTPDQERALDRAWEKIAEQEQAKGNEDRLGPTDDEILDRLAARLSNADNPTLADRTLRFLAGDLPEGDSMPRANQVPLNIRLADEDIARLDALIPYVESLPHIRAGGKVTRSTVHRLVVFEGLQILEERAKAAKRKR